jgi:hypothetical protein
MYLILRVLRTTCCTSSVSFERWSWLPAHQRPDLGMTARIASHDRALIF